jgi:hypothetical protein
MRIALLWERHKKSPLEIPRSRWEDDIIIGIRELELDDSAYIYLAQDGDQ